MAKKKKDAHEITDNLNANNEPIEIQLAKNTVLNIKTHKGKPLFFTPDSEYTPEIKRIETPILSLNKLLSDKWGGEGSGFAMGKIYNFYGPESIGKSALAAQIASLILQNGGKVLWLDKEDSFEPYYFKTAFDIDWWNNKNFILAKPDTAEAAFDIIQAFVDNKAADLIVLDSIAALGAANDMENDASANSMAAVARRLATHFQRITGRISITGTSVIYINQIRVNLSGGMAYGEKSTGGNPMRFYPHVTIRFKKKGNIVRTTAGHTIFVGTDVLLETEKNKTAWPHIQRVIPLYPMKGFSKEADLINLGIENNIIKYTGAWLTFNGKNYRGFDGLRTELENNPDFFMESRRQILDILLKADTKNTYPEINSLEE